MTEIDRALRGGPGDEVPAAALDRFSRAAAAQGLVDVAYATLDSPLGPIVVAATPRGLVRVAYADERADAVVDDLARRVSPRVLAAPERLDHVRRALDDYFDGRRTELGITLDWSLTAGFTRRVLQATARIPYGSVSTYAGVARRAGNARASRAAGNALGSNPIPIVVPCHRVVRTGGALGGYTGGLHRKEFLLSLEGVALSDR